MSTSTTTVRRYVEEILALSGRSQRDIASDCGYVNANILTMFKNGRTRLPLEKVRALAKATQSDPARLLRLVLKEYHPQIWKTIQELLGRDHLLTEGEMALIAHLRSIGATDPIDLSLPENQRILGEAARQVCRRTQARVDASVTAHNALPKNGRHT
jgi:hypothetical protein